MDIQTHEQLAISPSEWVERDFAPAQESFLKKLAQALEDDFESNQIVSIESNE